MKLLKWLPRINRSDFLWITLSGFLYFLAFPKGASAPLVWVPLLPWLLFLNRRPPLKTALFLTAWMSLIIGCGGFHWITHAMQEFGNLPMALCLVGLVLFSLAGQPQLYLYVVLRKILLERFGLKPGPFR